jgi:hypothetical protein
MLLRAKRWAHVGAYLGVAVTFVQLATGNADKYRGVARQFPIQTLLLILLVNSAAGFSFGAAAGTIVGWLLRFYSSSRRRWASSYFALWAMVGAATAATVSMAIEGGREVTDRLSRDGFLWAGFLMTAVPVAGGAAGGVVLALLLSRLGDAYFKSTVRPPRSGAGPGLGESPP